MSESLHRGIFKSTSIIGGSSAVSILFRILQTKAVALLIGPSGVGLMGLLNSALTLGITVSSLGLPTSGIRRIAEASNEGPQGEVARVVTVFRGLALVGALVGALLFFALRDSIAMLTFGNKEHAGAVGVLSAALFLSVIAGADLAIIRGLRRVGDLARATVLGIALGTVLGIPLLFRWRLVGVVPYIVLSASMTAFVAWWYARKPRLPWVRVPWRDATAQSREMLTLGVVFMVTGLVGVGATYLIKVVITRTLGLEAAGLYEAASTLSSVYVGFILGAMAADFFPHLATVSGDGEQSNRLINAQVEVGLLIATPGVLLVLVFGPLVLRLLYSAEFVPAFEILRWQALGTFLRVISWPLGFLTLAKGNGGWYMFTEIVTNAVYLLAVVAGVRYFGLPGIGIGFFVMYIFHVGLMSFVARRLISFTWSPGSRHLILILLPVTLAAFLVSYFATPVVSLVGGITLAVGTAAFCWKSLEKLIGPEVMQRYLARLKALPRVFTR